MEEEINNLKEKCKTSFFQIVANILGFCFALILKYYILKK